MESKSKSVNPVRSGSGRKLPVKWADMLEEDGDDPVQKKKALVIREVPQKDQEATQTWTVKKPLIRFDDAYRCHPLLKVRHIVCRIFPFWSVRSAWQDRRMASSVS